MVCNAHWWSDLVEGQRVGAAAVARLHADPVFRAQPDGARGEVDALLASGESPARDRAADAAALEKNHG